jgi:hypothetical protein
MRKKKSACSVRNDGVGLARPGWRARPPLHGEFLALLGAVEKIKIDQFLVREPGLARVREEKRDFSLRRLTHSQERMRKKKSACFVRNDGWGAWAA